MSSPLAIHRGVELGHHVDFGAILAVYGFLYMVPSWWKHLVMARRCYLMSLGVVSEISIAHTIPSKISLPYVY